MLYKLTGQVIHIGEAETITDKLSKQILVVKTEDQYPQEIPFELVNKAIDTYQHIDKGDMVTIEFNLNGRAGKNGKWYGSNKVYKIEKHS